MDAIHTIKDYEHLRCIRTEGWLIGMCKNIQVVEYIWSLGIIYRDDKCVMVSAVKHDAPIEIIKWLFDKVIVSEKAYEIALKKNRVDLIKLFHTKYPTTISTLVVERDQLATENTELKKDMEMYKSFYDHYHGWALVTNHS